MKLVRLFVLGALAALVAASYAQYSSSTVTTVVPIIGIALTPSPSAAPTPSGAPLTIQPGDTIEMPNGLKLVVGPHTRVLPGTHLKVSRDGKDLGEATVPSRKPGVDFGVFGAAFSIAGPIPQPNGSFLGGTKTVWGEIGALDYHFASKNPTKSVGIGGWFFQPNKTQFNNLYQVHARVFVRKNFGFQIAYLNSTKYAASSATAHVLLDLDSSSYDPNAKTPWSIELGAGVLENFEGVVSVETGATTPHHTINASVFSQASIQLKHKVYLTASLWFIRDRNLDVTRLAVGLESKF